MPTAQLGDAQIYYEVHGSGYPLMIFAPGGLRSQLAFWRHSPSNPEAKPPWMDPMSVLSGTYRVVAMDQRNAGRSRAPVSGEHGWADFARDHTALADHLGIDRFHVMGGCIGASYCLKLCELAPDRITAAVLQNPIGHDPVNSNREVFANLVSGWAAEVKAQRPEIDDAAIARFGRAMFGGDFVFSVTRDFVRRCPVPLLVQPGDDPPHPAVAGEEVGQLAPNAEMMREWKGPAHLQAAIRRVSDFLARHTPQDGTRRAA
jgi:pimeloyl-ACP methyl ester carboxylesterase